MLHSVINHFPDVKSVFNRSSALTSPTSPVYVHLMTCRNAGKVLCGLRFIWSKAIKYTKRAGS